MCHNGSLAPVCDTADLHPVDLISICVHAADASGNELILLVILMFNGITVFRRFYRCTI